MSTSDTYYNAECDLEVGNNQPVLLPLEGPATEGGAGDIPLSYGAAVTTTATEPVYVDCENLDTDIEATSAGTMWAADTKIQAVQVSAINP